MVSDKSQSTVSINAQVSKVDTLPIEGTKCAKDRTRQDRVDWIRKIAVDRWVTDGVRLNGCICWVNVSTEWIEKERFMYLLFGWVVWTLNVELWCRSSGKGNVMNCHVMNEWIWRHTVHTKIGLISWPCVLQDNWFLLYCTALLTCECTSIDE